ncbi:hypothetical protein ABPG74_016274 [Tetrahymena malaccensis]
MMVEKIRYLLFVFLIVLKYTQAYADFNEACSSIKSWSSFFQNTGQCLLASLYIYYDQTNLDRLFSNNNFQATTNSCCQNGIVCTNCRPLSISYSNQSVIGQVLVYFQYYVNNDQYVSSNKSSIKVNSFDKVYSSELSGCWSGFCSHFSQVFNINSQQLSVTIDPQQEQSPQIIISQFSIVINYCPSFCQSCDPNNVCLQCTNGYYISEQNVCNSNKQCQPCHISCQTCDGLLNINCITCANAYFIQTNKICVPNCDQNQYADTINNISQKYCKQCQILCKSCSNGTTCDSCIDGYTLDSNKQCQSCHISCQTCDGLLNINCITCANAYFIQTNKICVPNCDQNQYADTINNSSQKYCKQCQILCKSCSNGITCDSCIDGYSLDSNKQCLPCDKTCQTCND